MMLDRIMNFFCVQIILFSLALSALSAFGQVAETTQPEQPIPASVVPTPQPVPPQTNPEGWARARSSIQNFDTLAPGLQVFFADVMAPVPLQQTPQLSSADLRALQTERQMRAAALEAETRAREEIYNRTLGIPLGGWENPLWGMEAFRQELNSNLRSRAAFYLSSREQRQNDLLAKANLLNVPLERGAGDNLSRLTGFVGDLPVYATSMSSDAADTIGVDELWPGGSTNSNLTGTGITIGAWEFGSSVQTNHIEFGSRVVQRDQPVNGIALNHATQVAGVLAATGLNSAAQGMSYQSDVDAYDTEFIQEELSSALAPIDQELEPLFLSNHSWGLVAGWNVEQTLQGQNAWFWRGSADIVNDSLILPDHAIRLGSYFPALPQGTGTIEFDDVAVSAPFHLLIWSAGNDRNDGPTSQQAAFIELFDSQGMPVDFPIPVADRPPPDGDAGGFDSLMPLGTAKNTLVVGAVEDIVGGYSGPADVIASTFTAFGPTDDGRIKPDIVANGVDVFMPAAFDGSGNLRTNQYAGASGTSFSAPSVTGAIALLHQRYRQLRPTARELYSSTYKAIAIHSAHEAGEHPGPDYRFGYGLYNAPGALEIIDNNFSAASRPHIKEILLKNADSIEFTVVSDGLQDLKVTICWTDPIPNNVDPINVTNDDPSPRLVHDLDLRVADPGSFTWQPWVLNPDISGESVSLRSAAAVRAEDSRNNVEQVFIPASSVTAGEYTIRVNHKGTLRESEQWVSIIVTGNTPQPKPEFIRVHRPEFTINPGELAILVEDIVVGSQYRLEESIDLLQPFTTEVEAVSAGKEQITFLPTFNPAADQVFYRIVEIED